MPPVAVLAGGRGTRLGAIADSVPKPLVEVAGEPFLFHPLRRLASAGVRKVVLCVGYLGEQIESVVGPRRFGMDIAYSYDGPELAGTLGALRRARPLLGERFLVLYGDTVLTLDYRELTTAWSRSRLPGYLAVLENRGRWGPSNTEVHGGMVVAHDKVSPTPAMRWIDYGVGGLTSACLAEADAEETDLSALYALLAGRGQLGAFAVTERFFEIGTPESLAETEAHLTGPPRG